MRRCCNQSNTNTTPHTRTQNVLKHTRLVSMYRHRYTQNSSYSTYTVNEPNKDEWNVSHLISSSEKHSKQHTATRFAVYDYHSQNRKHKLTAPYIHKASHPLNKQWNAYNSVYRTDSIMTSWILTLIRVGRLDSFALCSLVGHLSQFL